MLRKLYFNINNVVNYNNINSYKIIICFIYVTYFWKLR